MRVAASPTWISMSQRCMPIKPQLVLNGVWETQTSLEELAYQWDISELATERVTLPPQGALEIFYSDQQHSNFLSFFFFLFCEEVVS